MKCFRAPFVSAIMPLVNVERSKSRALRGWAVIGVLLVVVTGAIALPYVLASNNDQAGAPTGAESERCDQSYPSVCIAPAPPDLDCGDIRYRRFVVRGIDPHGFDSDRDGIGCEGE